MKFLIQIPQLIYGGAEKVLVNFANYLVDKGHTVEILEIYDRGYLKPQFDNRVKFDVICSNDFTKKYYVSFSEIKSEHNVIKLLIKIIKKIYITIVGYRRLAERMCSKKYKNKHYDAAINYLETEPPGFLLKYINADKYMQWIHIDFNRASSKIIIDNMDDYKMLDNIICVSNASKQSMSEIYPELKDKISVIYNFFCVDEVKKKSKDIIQSEIFKPDALNVLSIGRMVEQKGYLRALNVILKLKREDRKIRWYIIGDGEDRGKIEKFIENNELMDNVILLGLKDNPYPYIKSCDLFFLPSFYEGFPTVTIEAKILNKPVLATDVCGIREQIKDREQGVIVENSTSGIYKGLRLFLDNPNLIDKFSSSKGMDDVLDNNIKYNKFMNIMEE